MTKETSHKPLDLPIYFLVGQGRSGSTLLQLMLDAHSKTIAPFESRFVVHFMNKYGNIRKWTTEKKDSFISDVLGELKIRLFWELNEIVLRQRIHALPVNTSYGMMCKQVYVSCNSFFNKKKKKVIIDKNPIYALLIPLLKSVYPNAKFIHLVRDFRASVNSYFKLQPFKSLRELGFMWVITNTKIEKHKAICPDVFHTLTHENLVQKPEHELKRLCQFLGLNFEYSMLEYYKTMARELEGYIHRAPSEESNQYRKIVHQTIHANISKPLNLELLDSWKRNLSKSQIETLESICGHLAVRYGYFSRYVLEVSPQTPLFYKLQTEKLNWYYRMPILIRELKSKPDLALLPKNEKQ